MTAPVNEQEVRLEGARAQSIAEVNFLEMRNVALTGEQVSSIFSGFCIAMRHQMLDMPKSLKSIYDEALAQPGRLYRKETIISVLNAAD